MGFLDFFKNKKQQPGEAAINYDLQTDIERFEKELFSVVPRYISKPGAKVDIRARHKDTNEIIPFAVGFPEQFEPWRRTKSLADRRSILYSLLDSQFGKQLQLWQLIERFNDDRYAENALRIAVTEKQEKDLKDSNYWAALARTQFILSDYQEAKQNCLKAMELDPGNIRTKRIYADVLHCCGQQEEAHKIYNEILSSKLPKEKQMDLPVQDLLGFDGDLVNSPIYAFSWLKADAKTNAAAWHWANEEFYYSPQFRCQYAFHLVKTNEPLKGFAKLLSLSQEMPWYKDAVVNANSLIEQLKLDETMREEKRRLQNLITKNNWNL